MANKDEKVCRKCLRTLAVTEFHRDGKQKDGLFCRCKSCVSEDSANYYRKNSQRKLEKAKLNRAQDPDKSRKRVAASKIKRPDLYRKYNAWYRSAHPAKNRASVAAYRAARIQATPGWANRNEIREIYERALELGLEVDHIVPLKGKHVCGLHVAWNLQLLSKSENCRKGNRVEGF